MARPRPAILFIFVTLFLDIFGVGLIVPSYEQGSVQGMLNRIVPFYGAATVSLIAAIVAKVAFRREEARLS